jgi:hypothetical protein
MAGFNPKQYLIKLQGKEYLEVRWRVVWFRETHPTGAITTELVATEPTVIVRAQVHGGDGVLLASDYGTAPAAGKGTWTGRSVEKASTAAIGRALALAGFGTQFDADDEGDNLADSPVDPPRKVDPRDQAVTDAIMEANAKANERAAANGWTHDQAKKLGREAHDLNVSAVELLALLNVAKLSDYEPGYTAASANLLKYAAARPTNAQPLPEVVF